MKSAVITAASALLISAALCRANWPSWRGPDGTGSTTEKSLPQKWSAKENVKWRAELPERGNSSPIVWGDKVFVTQALGAEKMRVILCFNRADGKQLWQSGLTYEKEEQTQRDNPYCSATPVTDGERVIASFGSAGLYCCDMNGKELWRRTDFGTMSHMFGNGSSPVLAGGVCVFPFGPDEKARLIAVDKTTGKTLWEEQPPKVDAAELASQRGGGNGGGRGAGGGGGGGGDSTGSRLAAQIVAQADRDADKKVSADELKAMAGTWFDKLDPDKTGKLSAEQTAAKWYDAVPPLDNSGGGASRGPSRTTAPAFFAAADTNKDGSLTREEVAGTFATWHTEWSKKGDVTQEVIAAGLDGAFPRQGGGRGFGGGGGGGRGGMGGATWSTPLLIKSGDREELVMGFPGRLAAYDPKTGSQLWISKGLGGSIYTTPVWGEGVIFCCTSGPGGGPGIAVKPGGAGDVSETHRVWRQERLRGCIGSGVISGGLLFNIGSEGVLECLDVKTGESVWSERLTSSGGRGGSWSSILLAGDKLYIPNQGGDVFVVNAARKFEVVATNSVNESTNASLAADKGELFLRTDKALYCIGAK